MAEILNVCSVLPCMRVIHKPQRPQEYDSLPFSLSSPTLSLSGPRSRVERPLSAARKASQEERDSEETACRVLQALQIENSPLQSPEPRAFSRTPVGQITTIE